MTPASFEKFRTNILVAALARAFTAPPDVPIWKWADDTVWIQSEDAAEPGPYRSVKTPWTRRLQELARRPYMWHYDYSLGRWQKVRISEINIQKSTQSGFTEAILNVIRWFVQFLPRNVMYRIDAVDRARKIARRLLRSLKWLDPNIFTGDPDDIKSTEFILHGMELWFIGSFSPGQATQVQAGIVVNDEVEEHAESAGETSTTRDSKYRKKTHRHGLEYNIGKPKLEGGPINKALRRGNCEEFHVACPHCQHLQWITHRSEEHESPFTGELMMIDPDTGEEIPNQESRKAGNSEDSSFLGPEVSCFANSKNFVLLPRPLPLGELRKIKTGRFVYEHCRDLLGNWDELRIKRDIYYECPSCKGKIFELKYDDDGTIMGVGIPQSLILEAAERDPFMLGWLPTKIGTPGIVSQRMSDLLSSDEGSFWGDIILELINAKKEGPKELMGVINNRFGNAFREELAKIQESDIRANVAGKTLWFVDYDTDLGHRRDVFDDENQARAVAGAVSAAAGDGLPSGRGTAVVIPSFCKPYKRGNIPFVPSTVILGSDVGGAYCRWVLAAALPNMIDAAVIDWGDELDPESITEIILNQNWPCLADGKRHRIACGFIDSHFRTTDVLRACWHVFQTCKQHRLIPTAMIGGIAARGMRTWSYHTVGTYRGNHFHAAAFKQLGYNFREAMNDVFITCVQKKQRRIFFPVDLAKSDAMLTPDERQFITELCNDQLIEDRNGRRVWADPPPGPNHYGAALKNAITGLRFLTRKHHLTRAEDAEIAEKLIRKTGTLAPGN